MKKLFLLGALSLAAVGVQAGRASAWLNLFGGHGDTYTLRITCRPYNAFDQAPCYGMAHFNMCGMSGMFNPFCPPPPSCDSGGCCVNSGCCESGTLPPAGPVGMPATAPAAPQGAPAAPGAPAFTPPAPTPLPLSQAAPQWYYPAPAAPNPVYPAGYQPGYYPNYNPGYAPGYAPRYPTAGYPAMPTAPMANYPWAMPNYGR